MSNGDKQIKFTFAVDQRTLETARAAIKALTSDIKTLVETMSRAGAGMGTLGQGGLFGGMSGKAGGINPAQQATIKGGSVMTQGIAADAKALSSSARLGIDAIRNMTTGLRDGVLGQVREIERLKSSLKDLNAEYERMGKGGPGGSTRISPGYLAEMNHARQSLQNAIDNHEVSYSRSRGGLHVEGFAEQGTKRVNGIDMVTNAAGNVVTPPNGPGAMAYAPGVKGLAMALLAGIGTTSMLANRANQAEVGNAEYGLNVGMRGLANKARIGSSVGQLGMSIRGGDLASSMAYSYLERTGTLGSRDGLGTDRERMIQEKSGLSSTPGQLGARAMDWIGRDISATQRGLGGNKLMSASSMAEANLRAEQSAVISEEKAKMVRDLVASSPKHAAFLNQAVSEAFGDIGMARTGGIGLGLNKTGTNTVLAEFKSRANKSGYSGEAWAGAMASAAPTTGYGLRGFGIQSLGLGLGGFGNANQVFAAGSQFGGGGRAGGQGLVNAVQHGIGRGGMDISAGSSLAGTAAGMMTGGNFYGSNGQAFMSGLMDVGTTGSVGGDMRMSRVMGAGLNEYGRSLSGQTDALQGGINMLSANASGAGGWYAKKALMTMDPALMLEIQRTGVVPQHLRDLGVTMDMVRDYNKTRNQFSFSRYMDEEGQGTAVGAAVAGVKAAGGVAEYMKQKGLTIHSKEGQRLIEQLGSARMMTMGGNIETNQGAILAELSGDKALAPGRHGHGAGAVGIKGTIQGAEAERQAKLQEEAGEFFAKNYETIKGGIRDMVTNEQALAGLTGHLVDDAKKFDEALQVLTGAIQKSLEVIAPSYAADLKKQAKEAASHGKTKAGPKPSLPKQSATGFGSERIDLSNAVPLKF
jgi:hypothetical protein